MFLLLALSILVVIILVVVAATVKRKATCKQTRQMAMEGPYYSTVGEYPVMEMTQYGSDVHCENTDHSENAHEDKIKKKMVHLQMVFICMRLLIRRYTESPDQPQRSPPLQPVLTMYLLCTPLLTRAKRKRQ